MLYNINSLHPHPLHSSVTSPFAGFHDLKTVHNMLYTIHYAVRFPHSHDTFCKLTKTKLHHVWKNADLCDFLA